MEPEWLVELAPHVYSEKDVISAKEMRRKAASQIGVNEM